MMAGATSPPPSQNGSAKAAGVSAYTHVLTDTPHSMTGCKKF